MNFLLVNNYGNKIKISLLENFLLKYGSVKIVNFKDLTSPNLNLSDIDCVVLSGSSISPIMLRGKEIFKNEIDFIKKVKIPIIGICFGFELLANAYRNNLILNKNKVKGIKNVKYKKSLIKVWENHFWSLKENNNLKVIAKSNYGIEVFKIINENKFGIQFHPEHESKYNNGYLIFNDLLRQIKE